MFRFLAITLTLGVLSSCAGLGYFYQIQENNQQYGLVKVKDSLTIIPFQYDTIYEPWGEWILNDKHKRYVDNTRTGGWYVGQKNGYLDIISIQKADEIYKTKEQYEDVKINAYILDFETFIFAVQQNGFWGVLDKEENKLVVPQYNVVDYKKMTSDFIFVKKDNKWGISDYNNQLITPIMYDSLITVVQNSFIIAMKDGQFGLITKNGKTAIPFDYDEIDDAHNSEDAHNTYFQYFKKEGINYASFYGNLVVRKDDKIGLLNIENEIVIDIKYDYIFGIYSTENQKVYAIYNNGKFGLMKTANQIILPIEYQNIKATTNKNYAFITKGDKVGVWNHEKESFLIAPQFDEIYDFKVKEKYFPPKKAFLLIKNNKKLYWIDKKGQILEEQNII